MMMATVAVLFFCAIAGVFTQQQQQQATYPNGQTMTTNTYTAAYSSNNQYSNQGTTSDGTLQYNGGASSQPIMYDQSTGSNAYNGQQVQYDQSGSTQQYNNNNNNNQYGGQQSSTTAAGNQYQTQYGSSPQQQQQQVQYDANGNQVQGYSSNGYSNSNSQMSQNSASSSTSSVSLMDYSFNNGNCQYKDGQVTENGQTRQATQQELAQIQTYRDSVDQYMSQVNGYVGTWISSVFQSLPSTNGSFPNIPTMPTMPTAPCLCSAQNCGTQTNTNAVGSTPQRDFYGNQQQYSSNGQQQSQYDQTQQAQNQNQNQYNQQNQYGQTQAPNQYNQQQQTTQQYQQNQNQYNQNQQTTQNAQQQQQYYGRKK